MLTDKIQVAFDCRKFNAKLAREQRELIAETDNISVSALFRVDELPELYKTNGVQDFCRPCCSRAEKNMAEAEKREAVPDMVSVRWKIGKTCKWYNEYGLPCDKVLNEELDKGRWMAMISFSVKPKDPANPLKPCGLWVNAIMMKRVNENPFADFAFEEWPKTKAAEVEAVQEAAEDLFDEKNDDLPFLDL